MHERRLTAGDGTLQIHNHACSAAVRLLLVVGLIAAGVCGCGPGHPTTYPVSGTVVFDDAAPLTSGGFIGFESTPADGLPVNARGVIRDDGTFVLSTFSDGDGAVAGRQRVLVRVHRKRPEGAQFQEDRIPPPVIDRRFERYATSGLEFTVEEGRNEFTVVVQRPGGPGATAR